MNGHGVVAACLLCCAATAHAADGPSLLFGDAVAVASARPLAIQGAMPRLGSGWQQAVRSLARLPQAVDPFDPALFSTIGLDAAATAWGAARPLRGAIHLRGVFPLAEARLAEALLSSVSALAAVKLTRTPAGAWLGALPHGDALVVRLDGKILVVDGLLGNRKPVAPAELARLVPLRPPRALQPRGAGLRMGPATAIGLWLDLEGLAGLGLIQSEIELASALGHAAPAMRAELQKTGRKEIATCRAALRRPGTSFDDLFVGVALKGPEALELELALGGKRDAIDALRGSSTPATRTLVPADLTSELRVALVEAGPVRAALRPSAQAERPELPRDCPLMSRAALALRSWPALLGAEAAAQARSGRKEGTFLRVLSGLRGLAAYLPAVTASGKRGDEAGVNPRDLLVLAELEDAARGDIDRLLIGTFAAASPLRVAGRQVTTYAIPPSPFFGQVEGPVVTVDPLPGATTGTLVGFGTRERLRVALERIAPVENGAPPPPSGTVARATAGPHAVARLVRDGGFPGGERATLTDGIAGVEAALTLEPELLRADVDVALRAPAAR